jgi:hypothetical protein
MNLEDLFDNLAHEHDIAIFCSFLMDNFDAGTPEAMPSTRSVLGLARSYGDGNPRCGCRQCVG